MNRRTAFSSGVAPLLMVGFEGTSVPPHLARWLRDGTVGGVVLFSRNVGGPGQVRELCRSVRAAAGRGHPAPLIAIDQEGGRVRRLKDPEFTQFPPARSLSLISPRGEATARSAGRAAAAEIAVVGIDINFAPVLDVDDNVRNWAVGDRSISSDPETAAALGVAWAHGSLDAGVVPVGKHFPGHGSSEADSHEELPVVRASRRTLLARDLVPFRAAVRAGIPAIMTAHILYTALDRTWPATLSRRIIGDLLRGAMRFRGFVFSDALEMKAIAGRYRLGEAAVRAAVAGCDALLVCRGEELQEEVIEALARAKEEDSDFRAAAAASARRAERLRETLSRVRKRRPGLRSVGSKRHRELAALLRDRWESIGRTSGGDRSDNIGEG
ncbi:MAG: beta-N-acetylhexosaminidase [Deltaproteobacteria bacterium]|nr:beta-N-acetylhexosaminidase [Deltaproteobacteria bacterium]